MFCARIQELTLSCIQPPEKLSFPVFVIEPYGPFRGERVKSLGKVMFPEIGQNISYGGNILKFKILR